MAVAYPLPDFPGWTQELEEVSSGVYRLIVRKDGHPHIDLKGTDLDQQLREAVATISKWESERLGR